MAHSFSSLLMPCFDFFRERPDPMVGGRLLSLALARRAASSASVDSGRNEVKTRLTNGLKVAMAAQVMPEANSAMEKQDDAHVS